jgi:CRP-like cAMP-binding protein
MRLAPMPSPNRVIMSIDQLLNIFLKQTLLFAGRNSTGLYPKLYKFLSPLVTFSIYPRSHLILTAGQVADYMYFVERGLARGFTFDQKRQKESTVFLWKDQTTVIIPESFLQRKPSPLYIEVISETRMLRIAWYHISELLTLYPEAIFLSHSLQLQFKEQENRRNNQLSFLTAWQRYLQLLEDFPAIEQQLSKEIIASYLNITPQSLSRMLKKNRHP